MWSTSGPGFAATYGSWAFVFNADAWVAMTYVFTPQFKMSAGIRGDFYAAALTTYDINSGGLQNLNRHLLGTVAAADRLVLKTHSALAQIIADRRSHA